MCGFIGRVTGKGLAAKIKATFPRIVLQGVVMLLLVANILNIAADVAAMGEVAELATGLNRHLMTAFSFSERFCCKSSSPITVTFFS